MRYRTLSVGGANPLSRFDASSTVTSTRVRSSGRRFRRSWTRWTKAFYATFSNVDTCNQPDEVSAAWRSPRAATEPERGRDSPHGSVLFFGANRGQQAFGASQLSLNSIAGEEDFAFQFKREGNMQQIESAATKPVGVAFGKSAGLEQCFVTIRRGFHEPSTLQPAFDSGKSGVSLAQNGRPYAAGERSSEMKRALPNRVRDFQRVERKKIQGREF
jgi:hypothetical protein